MIATTHLIEFGPVIAQLNHAIAMGDVPAPFCNGRYVLDHDVQECTLSQNWSGTHVTGKCRRCGWEVGVKLIAMMLPSGGRLEFVAE